MKAHLLFRDRDFEWDQALLATAVREAERSGRSLHGKKFDRNSGLPWNTDALVSDLELETLFAAMAGDDDCVYEVARRVIVSGAKGDSETIGYRQKILQDCLDHPALVRELYAIAIEASTARSSHFLSSFMQKHPDHVLRWSIEILERLLGSLRKLRKLADLHSREFASEGWAAFFAQVERELDDDYIAAIQGHLIRLRFRNGVLLSARLDEGNKGAGYALHLPPGRRGSWLFHRVKRCLPRFFPQEPPVYGFSLHPRDESGFRALSELKNRGLGIAADTLGQSAGHVRDFFAMLRVELAFYVGCINLQEQVSSKGKPMCLPLVMPAERRALSASGLYDICLALTTNGEVVGNDLQADQKDLVIVTGANRGGKSTFLRSVGLAQVMMQCGMFVPAEAFGSSVCDGLFTHFKREEDSGMKSGKFDEELHRMSEILDHLTPRAVILFNESFAATNEREGSEIARQITAALQELEVRMIYVTHLYEFARNLCETKARNLLALRAERQADGTRTFKLIEAGPLQTSYGEDLYHRIFGDQDTDLPQEDVVRRRAGSG